MSAWITDRNLKSRRKTPPSGQAGRRALVTGGSVILGNVVARTLVRRAFPSALQSLDELPRALDAPVEQWEMMEGIARYYCRPGTGAPLILLHSINAAASSHEMKPLFQHYAEHTSRPVCALEWLGFGLSDRPAVAYAPEVYQRQLRRFLTERINRPADIIAFSLAGEYAATVANQFPRLVRKLVLLAPTALSRQQSSNPFRRFAVRTLYQTGLFELLFYRLTRYGALQRFYQENVFGKRSSPPLELVEYAFRTSHVRGAHHAPHRFIEGALFLEETARNAYRELRVPTLLVLPENHPSALQDFELADEIVAANRKMLRAARISTGLMPQWENLKLLTRVLGEFLG